ncbi:MAG TPA: hypothetical protein PKM73_12295 [Verrucomicrobiota bacterium]|nr:hypothetical protein [Verrucomicrobiota bacterium]HNU51443.1 hypothetical protein [Verrucomicrobiota bacterium]
MSDNTTSTPGAGVPPKPAEPVKVQPKKETVRISLPAKPTAAPTIKIPAPSAPGPAAAPVAAAAPVQAPAAAAGGGAAPVPVRPTASAAPATAPSAGGMGRPMAGPARSGAATVSMLDSGLAIAAAVIGVIALVRVFLLIGQINN